MTHDDVTDVERMLAGLRPSDSDAARSERVRTKCHGMLARATAARAGAHSGAMTRTLALESALVGAFCLVYIGAVAMTVLQVHLAG